MSQVKDSTKKRECKHLSFEERKIIEKSLKKGLSPRQIAANLFKSKSTITREIKRGLITHQKVNTYYSRNPSVPDFIQITEYDAYEAQKRYEESRSHCRNKLKLIDFSEFFEFAQEQRRTCRYSPDSIVGFAKANNMFEHIPCTKTLYNYIDMRLLDVRNIDLLLKVRRKPRKSKCCRKHKRLYGTSIDERPDSVNERMEFGHWEGDSVVGKDGKSSILTLVERKTGELIIMKVKAKTSDETIKALKRLKRQGHFRDIFKSITFDNGSEFASADLIEKLGMKVYFAHPYSAYERGQNENTNGIIRRYLPKGTDLSVLSQKQLCLIAQLVNNMPRKKFNYSTADMLFQKELSAIIALA